MTTDDESSRASCWRASAALQGGAELGRMGGGG